MADGQLASASPDGGPRQFGRYELLYRFASGGMADLYLGRLLGEDEFERLVALKVIHTHLSEDPNFVKMFIDEARLASRISHPNVALTLDLGRVGKTHFIAMEYVDGESVVALLRRTRPPPTYCARIIADAAAGLHAAHQLRGADGHLLGVVHRDVSPQNILVSYDGAVKVVDFGVARARGSLHSTSGEIKGKFSYMAPEQLLDPASVDRRTDIFALGVVLYEMTTWTRLFKAETEADQIHKVLKSVIPRPSQRVPDYPPELESLVMRALSRDQDTRFADALELQRQLELYIMSTGQPITSAEIALMMRKAFNDRIQEKHELLTRATRERRATSTIITVEQSSGSSMVLRSGASFFGSPHRRRLLVVGLGLLLLAVAATLVTYLALSPRRQRVADARLAPPTATSPTQVTGPVSADAPTPIRQITISVQARPAGATILLGGRAVGNPETLRQPAGEGEAELLISAPGHQPQRYRVPLATGGAWNINLERLPGQVRKVRRPGGKKKGLEDDDVLSNPYR